MLSLPTAVSSFIKSFSSPPAIQQVREIPRQQIPSAPIKPRIQEKLDVARRSYINQETFALEPKRIKRMRVLATEGAHGLSTIEGLKINGCVAQAFITLYDQVDNAKKDKMVQMPIAQVFMLVANLMEKKAI